ncbi:hypothetical protein FHS27_001820 [Rhodopirellula rubra]|uniref:Uncharacterized protein n=1 Tax=Aporhodopirellula rubra TaxID=980271 RepID=A0A7W5DYK9_9BACT|nr:hypothetical protein [Aporhodopirellula rubra]
MGLPRRCQASGFWLIWGGACLAVNEADEFALRTQVAHALLPKIRVAGSLSGFVI